MQPDAIPQSIAYDVCLVASSMLAQLDQHTPTLLAHALAIKSAWEQVEREPPVKGYEPYFGAELEPLAARFLAINLQRLGREFHQEALAAKQLGGAVGQVVRAANGSTIVISNRARTIARLLDDPSSEVPLRQAWEKAQVSDSLYSFFQLVARAADRDPNACADLVKVCKALKPHLPNPKGRKPTQESATHELLIATSGKRHSYADESRGVIFRDYLDPETQATREAFGDPDFDPRSSSRRRCAADGRAIRARALR